MTATPLQSLGRAVKQLQSRHHRALDARLAEVGASLAQWDALRAIDALPGASAHELAECCFMTDQSFGALAGRLADRGLISRTQGKGRALSHALTERGTEVLRAGGEVADQVLTRSFAPLTEAEKAQFLALIRRLLADGPAD